MALNSSFSNLYISEKWYFNVSPQAYYLLMDDLKVFYIVGFVSLIKKRFPAFGFDHIEQGDRYRDSFGR